MYGKYINKYISRLKANVFVILCNKFAGLFNRNHAQKQSKRQLFERTNRNKYNNIIKEMQHLNHGNKSKF